MPIFPRIMTKDPSLVGFAETSSTQAGKRGDPPEDLGGTAPDVVLVIVLVDLPEGDLPVPLPVVDWDGTDLVEVLGLSASVVAPDLVAGRLASLEIRVGPSSSSEFADGFGSLTSSNPHFPNMCDSFT